MILTNEQRDAISIDGHVYVRACPGSGKTRALTAKLLDCIDNVRDTTRRIACITYTNTAVHEIENRLRKYGRVGDSEHCDISTVHAFCLQAVLRPFGWMLDELTGGFSIAPPDSDEFQRIAIEVCTRHRIQTYRNVDAFGNVNRNPDGSPVTSGDLTPAAVSEFWEKLLSIGMIDFSSIIYYSYRLLCNVEFISRGISSRYMWMLVDEVQDTTELQVEILRKISVWGKTTFFLVGDEKQSIYSFAGAKPKAIQSFAREIGARLDAPLSGNFRSSPQVIAHAERLLGHFPPMEATGDAAKLTGIVKWQAVQTSFEGIVDHFLPAAEAMGISRGECAVIAPWWLHLYHLGRALREYGVSVTGPGARPYKRSHTFAVIAEQVCAAIESVDPEQVSLVERDLFFMLNSLTDMQCWRVYTYEGRCLVHEMLSIGRMLRAKYHGNGVKWLRVASKEFATLLVRDELLTRAHAKQLVESVDEMLADMKKNKVDLNNLSVEDLGLFASTKSCLKLITMHKSKGREFDAVAVINAHEGAIPHFTAKSAEEIMESRRQLYVASTRARKLLMVVTDSSDSRNKPSRFLTDMFS